MSMPRLTATADWMRIASAPVLKICCIILVSHCRLSYSHGANSVVSITAAFAEKFEIFSTDVIEFVFASGDIAYDCSRHI